jgi:hypothetical protein
MRRVEEISWGVVLARVEQGQLEELVLRGWLEEGLTEAEDRELFGLAPVTSAP